MSIVIIILIILAALAAAAVLLVFGVALFAFCRINNKRYNGNKNLRYFTASDFPGLLAEPVSFVSDRGQTLRGFLYLREGENAPKALLVFAHGFGAGHLAYTTEIDSLASAGYWILAYDATGCGASDGKNLRGFDQGVTDLRSAIRFADRDRRFSGMKKILVGHSWGAFCVMNALSAESVSGAVAMCGFISGAKVLAQNTVGEIFPPLTFLAEWFLRLLNRLRFGRSANRNSLKSIKATEKPLYLLYGSADKTVKYRHNGAVVAEKCAGRKNIVCRICEGRGHNPYLTEEAEKSMHQTFSAIAAQKKKDLHRALEMYKEIDYAKITEEDADVMRSIVEFCDRIVREEN